MIGRTSGTEEFKPFNKILTVFIVEELPQSRAYIQRWLFSASPQSPVCCLGRNGYRLSVSAAPTASRSPAPPDYPGCRHPSGRICELNEGNLLPALLQFVKHGLDGRLYILVLGLGGPRRFFQISACTENNNRLNLKDIIA